MGIRPHNPNSRGRIIGCIFEYSDFLPGTLAVILVTAIVALIALTGFMLAGLPFFEALDAWTNLLGAMQLSLGFGIAYLAWKVNDRRGAKNELQDILTTLDIALTASESSEPQFFRYPHPSWADFEKHIYRRNEVDLLKEDLQKESVSLVVGKPGSGKTVLVQMVGYELRHTFDYIFYEDFASVTDRMYRWHHQTERGDEYRLGDCLKRISRLSKRSDKDITALVILDNTHRYFNFTRHLRDFTPSRLPERVSVLLAMRPGYSTIEDELVELQRKSHEGFIDLLPVEGSEDELDSRMRGILGEIESLRESDAHDFSNGYLTPSHRRKIPCRVLTDARTKDVVMEVLKWGRIRFKDEKSGEGWVRARIGASLSLLAFFVLSMVDNEGRIDLDQSLFRTKVVEKFEILEDALVRRHLAADYSESALRGAFQGLLKTLGWFAFLDVALPEVFLLEQGIGFLGEVDRESVLRVLNYLVSQREITRGGSRNQVNYSLPHKSLGSVILEYSMGVDFSQIPSKHPDAKLLTQMALDIFPYLNETEEMHLMSALMILSLVENLVESSMLCEYLEDPEKLARVLVKGVVLPAFAEKCPSLATLPGLPEALIALLKESDLESSIDFLTVNLSTASMIDILLDDRIVEIVVSRIVSGTESVLILAGIPNRSLLWHNPRIREAIITRVRELILSTDDAYFAFSVLNLAPEICHDKSIVEAVRGSVSKVVKRIKGSENGWLVLTRFSQFDDILEHEKVIEAVLSKSDPIPDLVEASTIRSILKHDGYLSDERFQRALVPYIESMPISEMSFIMSHEQLLALPEIREVIMNTVIAADKPWKMLLDLESCEHLKETDWGKQLMTTIIQKFKQAILEIQPPYSGLIQFAGTDCLCSESEIMEAIELKSSEISAFLLQGEDAVIQMMPVLVSLWILPDCVRTKDLENAVLAQSETITKLYGFFPSELGATPLRLMLAFPKLAKEDAWIKVVEERLELLGPHIEDLFVIATIPELNENKKIRSFINKRIDVAVASFYDITTRRERVAYICEKLPFLKRKKAVQKSLRNLGLS